MQVVVVLSVQHDKCLLSVNKKCHYDCSTSTSADMFLSTRVFFFHLFRSNYVNEGFAAVAFVVVSVENFAHDEWCEQTNITEVVLCLAITHRLIKYQHTSTRVGISLR